MTPTLVTAVEVIRVSTDAEYKRNAQTKDVVTDYKCCLDVSVKAFVL